MSQRVTLDGTDMRARLRSHRHAMQTFSYVPRPPARTSRQLFQDINASSVRAIQEPMAEFSKSVPTPIPSSTPKAFDLADPALDPYEVLGNDLPQKYSPGLFQQVDVSKMSKPRLAFMKPSRSSLLTAMAVTVFLVGISVSFIGFRTNNVAQAQIRQINQKSATAPATTTDNDSTPPTTNAITVNDVEAYKVAPDLARTIRIPKLGVYARVLQVGVTKTGALATPTNVFDTAWYKGSAKPGLPGATLIDGHVSSWTTNGVFYGIKNLVAGDEIDIQKGDNSLLKYTVVKTVAYDVNDVDMSALMKPVPGTTHGLNLITCGGKYDSKAGEFTQRIAVFAQLEQ